MCNSEVSFIFGYIFDYFVVPYLLSISTIVFLLTFWYFPESPMTLLKKYLEDKAKKSMSFYKAHNDLEILVQRNKDLLDKKEENISWKDFTTPSAKRALSIGLLLMTLN